MKRAQRRLHLIFWAIIPMCLIAIICIAIAIHGSPSELRIGS